MSGRRSLEDGHGLTPRETRIIEALESGKSPSVISLELGLGLETVLVMRRRYIIGDQQLNGYERQCRAGEAKYRAALLATGKVYA